MVVIDQETYKTICDYINNFNGLSIDCERILREEFKDVDSITVSAIHAKEWQKRVKHNYVNIKRSAAILVKE